MKPNGLLAAVAVLAVLGGLVWWTNKHPKAPDAPATPAAPKMLSVAENQIEGIRIAKSGGDPVVLKKLGDTWVIAEPKQMAADQDVVKQLTSAIAGLNADRLIDEHPASLNEFGLTTPSEELEITSKGGAVNKILLGSDTPSASDTYARVGNKPAVYTVASFTKTSLDKSVNDLRDKRMLPFNQDKLTVLSVTSKGPAFEFGKNGAGEWQVTKPKPLRADPIQVDDFVRKLKEAKMDLAAAADATQYTSGSKIGTVSATDNSGTQTLEIHKGKDNSYYAKSTAVEGIYKLAGDFGEALKEKEVDSFRNKKLFDFGFNDPSRIEIGGTAYVKSGDKWTGPSGQVDSSGIQSVMDKLRDLSAIRFNEKSAGTEAVVLTVTSGDNHKVERVIVNKSGDEYNAMREGEPAVYAIDAKVFDELQKAIAGIKPYQAPKSDKK